MNVVNMSDNEDLLGDDLGDHSLADYNLGNDEEDQLLADDYDTNNSSQNVPTSVGASYGGTEVPVEYSRSMDYPPQQPTPYHPPLELECVVPNITVEVQNPPENVHHHPTYAPYEPPVYEPEVAVVPPAMLAAPLESPQIVPTDVPVAMPTCEPTLLRERFPSERAGGPRTPQVRDIPDSLDKVFIPRGGYPGRGRTSWRNPQFQPRYSHPYRRNNVHRGNFNHRPSFPPPQIRPNPTPRPEIRPEFRPEFRPDVVMRPEFPPDRPDMRPDVRQDNRPEPRPDMRPDIRPDMRPVLRPDGRPDMPPDMRPDMRQDIRPDLRPDMRPDLRPDMRPDLRTDMRHDMHPGMRPDHPDNRPDMRPDIRLEQQMGSDISPERHMHDMHFRHEPRFGPRFQNFRPNMDDRNFGPRPGFPYRPNFNQRPFPPHIREMPPSHLPQVIRQSLPGLPLPKMDKFPQKREQEVIMLPVQLPPSLPPGGLAGKKVLINPHFKGSFQPPVEGMPNLPTYIPTRIHKTPPLSPTLESKFGPATDIEDAAERFIAEQRNALARAANRKMQRRSPQRYIENTTIEIENDMMGAARRDSELELLRKQEEFIHANRAGLRRRMRTPSPTRRSLSPRRSPERTERIERTERSERDRVERDRRHRDLPPRPHDEDSEYRRRVREQESLRERVLRAKEVRRRKNAAALHQQLTDRDRERQDKEKPKEQPKADTKEKTPEKLLEKLPERPSSTDQDNKPDTTRKSPEKLKTEKREEVEKCSKVVKEVEKVRERTPVREEKVEVNSTCEELTPPLPTNRDSDDDLDLILGDIDGILSDDDDSTPTPAPAATKAEPKSKQSSDLRSKLPPKDASKPARQKIVFQHERTPPRRAVVTSSTKTEDSENGHRKSNTKTKTNESNAKRPRIIFENKEPEKAKSDDKKSFTNRRVILQRNATKPAKEKSVFTRIEAKSDPTKPNPGIFSRAVRTAIGTDKNRIVIKKIEEPKIEYESDSDIDEDKMLDQESGNVAIVKNLPHGMTDTRLKTLAGENVQSLSLDKDERSAKITFKSTAGAETFKKKFNSKMVAASRLTVTLR